MRSLIRILTLLAALAALAGSVAAQGTTMTWTVEGVQRVALVFAPAPTIAGVKHPIVFVFHGHGGNMQGMAQSAHIQTFWPGAIVVYPQGVPTPSPGPGDPQGLRPGWQFEAGQTGTNDRDLKFFDAMLATFEQKFSVDDQRIYSTGFSNGAIFSYLLWAERGKVLAAFGICAGMLWSSEHLTEPRAAAIVGGTADTTLPFTVQQQSIEAARQVDNATGAGQPCGPGCTRYPSTSQTPVVTRIHSGGHVYPPWASQFFVNFFKLHKHP